MANVFSPPMPFIGSVGFVPDFRVAAFPDDYEKVTTAGYLNRNNLEGVPPLSTNSVIMAFYNYSTPAGGSINNFNFFGVAIDDNGVITLQGW